MLLFCQVPNYSVFAKHTVRLATSVLLPTLYLYLRNNSARGAGAGRARVPRLTFLLFAAFALVADLDGAHGQDDGHDEEQDAAHHARRDRFVLHPRWHRELHLLGTLVAGCRVGQHSEVVRSPAD